ncbi:MAG: hypothetical protein M3362_22235 [Acidobacteriota bacterium]|nr:hypothetical protein [Acidobacteriota bacterium]
MSKKWQKNLPKADPKEFIEQLVRVTEKYAGREPTIEELSDEIKALNKDSPRPTKDELKARQVERLQEYIGLANKLPPNYQSPDIKAIVGADPRAPREGTTEYMLKRFRYLLFYLAEPGTPSDFREYILEDVTDAVMSFVRAPNSVPEDEVWKPLSGVYSALQRYDEFHETREKLRNIARMKVRRHMRWPFSIHNYISVYSFLTSDSDGILQLHLDRFAETVKGLEADRIRECPICQRIFWASPKSKMSCSPRCRNLFNVRKHRELIKKNKARS